MEALGRKRVEELSCRCTPPMERAVAPDVPVVAPIAANATPTDRDRVATTHSDCAASPAESAPLHNNEGDIESATAVEVETSQEACEEKPETPADEVKIDVDVVAVENTSTGPDNADVQISEADAAKDPKSSEEDVEA